MDDTTAESDEEMTPSFTGPGCTRRLAAVGIGALILTSTACQSSVASEPSTPAGGDASAPLFPDYPPTPLVPSSVEPIASDFDVSEDVLVDEEGLPESSASEPSGSFRFLCEMSHLGYDDPIVYPNQPGASHLHMFFGNADVDAYSSYSTLREHGDGTCQGGPVNRSGYWAPAVLTADGKVVRPKFISVYYKGPGSTSDGSIADVETFPAGLRMIAGQDLLDPVADAPHDWYCEINQVKSDRIPDCGPDELVGVSLPFPSCWNGTELDSRDHRSHMAYEVRDPNSGVVSCPSSHPVPMPEFTLGIWFEHDGNSSEWYLSSDRADGMEPWENGASFHSDWFGGWDPDVQELWIDRCINGLLNCSGGQLGDGTRLSGLPEDDGPSLLPIPDR